MRGEQTRIHFKAKQSRKKFGGGGDLPEMREANISSWRERALSYMTKDGIKLRGEELNRNMP